MYVDIEFGTNCENRIYFSSNLAVHVLYLLKLNPINPVNDLIKSLIWHLSYSMSADIKTFICLRANKFNSITKTLSKSNHRYCRNTMNCYIRVRKVVSILRLFVVRIPFTGVNWWGNILMVQPRDGLGSEWSTRKKQERFNYFPRFFSRFVFIYNEVLKYLWVEVFSI